MFTRPWLNLSAVSGRLVSRRRPALYPHLTTTRRRARSTRSPNNKAACSGGASRVTPRHQNNARQVKGRSLRTCPSFPNIGCCCLYKLDNVCPRVPPPASSHSSPPTPSQTRWTRTRVKNHAGPQFRGAFAEEPRYDGCIGHPAGRAECGWRFCSGVGSLIDADFAEGLTDMYV